MGRTHGMGEPYFESGQLWSKSIYKDGKRHGPDEFYDIYGKLRWQRSYSMGKECGKWFDDGETKTYPPCPDFEQTLLRTGQLFRISPR